VDGNQAFEHASCCPCVDTLVQLGAAVSPKPSAQAPLTLPSLLLPATSDAAQSASAMRTMVADPIPATPISQSLRTIVILA
jgi:hypothetical protein